MPWGRKAGRVGRTMGSWAMGMGTAVDSEKDFVDDKQQTETEARTTRKRKPTAQ